MTSLNTEQEKPTSNQPTANNDTPNDSNEQASKTDNETTATISKKQRKKSLFKSLGYLFIWFLLLLFLLLLLLFFLLSTDFGSKAFVGLSNQHIKTLNIKKISGNLLTDFNAEAIQWQGKENEKVEIYNFALKNDFSTVLNKQIYLSHLYADHIIIHLPETKTTKTKENSVTKIELPWAININDLKINKLEIRQGEQQHIINNIQLSAEAAKDHLHIKHFTAEPIIQAEPLRLSLTGESNINEPYTLAGKFLLDYHHANYGKATADINLNGDINNYQLLGNAILASPKYGDLQLVINGDGTQQDFNIKELNFNGLEGSAKAEGYIAWKNDLLWDVKMTLDHLHTEKLYADSPAILSTHLQSKGKKQGDNITLDLTLMDLKGKLDDYPLAGKATLTMSSNKEKTAVNIEDLDIHALGGKTTFIGDVAIKEVSELNNNKKNIANNTNKNITWDGQLSLQDIQANALLTDLPKDLTTHIITHGELLNDKIDAHIDLQKLSGTLKGYPLSASGKLITKGVTDDLQVNIEQLNAKALEGEASFIGKLNIAQQDITWDGQLTTKKLKLQHLNKDLPQNLSLQLTTLGEKKSDHLQAKIDLAKLNGRIFNSPLRAKGKIDVKGKTDD